MLTSATVSYSKLGLYISNAALKALLFKILGDYRVRVRDSYVEGKLRVGKATRLSI